MLKKQSAFIRRKGIVRKKLKLLAIGKGRNRLTVFRSNKYIYAQIIDDVESKTIVSASSLEKEIQDELQGATNNFSNILSAKAVGKFLALRAKEKGVFKLYFDRGGYIYHGRVKALADVARQEGMSF